MANTARSELPRARFFVLRAPLLPVEAFERWSDGLRAAEACGEDDERLADALAADRALLRERLAELVADEQVGDGLALVSANLFDAVPRWRASPDSKRGRATERSLVRYVTRVATRPDLFGVSAAYAIGGFADTARLELSDRADIQLRARVDAGILRNLVRRAADAALDSPSLVVRRKPDVYRVGGRLRVAARKRGTTGHRLVEVRATRAIELALELAAEGATVESLVAAVAAEVEDAEHARRVVRRLLSSELLVPVAELSATGPEPSVQAVRALESLPGGEVLAAGARQAIAAVPGPTRVGRGAIAAVVDALSPTGIEIDPRLCVHVDSRRPGDIRLTKRVETELQRAVDLLARVSPPASGALEQFKAAFEQRFGTRRVPLLQALDPDFGIRLSAALGGPAEVTVDDAHVRRRRALLALLDRGMSTTRACVELGEADLVALSGPAPAVLPSAFAMLTSVVGRDAAAIDAGDFLLAEPSINGPSGARLLGRLCQGDDELERHVREHLRCEAAADPDAVFAELSLVPETDAGLNITQRPVLREWEIEYGGAAGGPVDRRLQPNDLIVSIEDEEVVLRSTSLGRRVIPCCTTAMNLSWVSLPAARFLVSIAHQRVSGYLEWSWGELADAPLLPRVTSGRTLLSLRRWNVPASELAEAGAGTDAQGFRRLREWRARRGIPRLVALDHPKGRLLVDFDNVLSVDAFLATAAGLDMVRLIESLAAQESPLEGPDGRYVHELIVPFVLERERVHRPAPRPAEPVREQRRRFTPGSEWLYANLYGPIGAADRVLVDHVGATARRLRDDGAVDGWFFIRYADPANHLRVRFHGEPRTLLNDVLPAVNEALAPALADGLLYRISLDTYEREVERYGGVEGVEVMEQVAAADSDAVIALLEQKPTAAVRHRLAVASLAALYQDSGLGLVDRHAICLRLRSNWLPRGVHVGDVLGARERAERADVAQTVAALDAVDGAEPWVEALRARSLVAAPLLRRLRTLDDEALLERSFADVVSSLAHMSVNRLLRRGGNLDEVRVHHALARIYEGRIACERSELAGEPA